MAFRFSEKGEFVCAFCGAKLESEEEVVERMCLSCINKMGTGWSNFFKREVRSRPR